MKKIGLVYNATRKENIQIIDKLEKYLNSKGVSTWRGKTAVVDSDWKHLNEPLDLAIIIGGDGTLLGASRALAPKGIPMIGISAGHLGFLTESRQADPQDTVEKILRNEYKIEERAMLCSYILSDDPSNKKEEEPMCALNDVVINRGTNHKMIYITLKVDDNPVADYAADGLIISTPTGSTAYALSSGGAVMDPEIRGIEIVPICAHTLTSRPHIVSDNRVLTIEFTRPHEGTILQVDGQETYEIKDKTKIKISRAKHSAKLVRLIGKENGFYWRVREKFHWGSTTQ